MIDLKDLRVGDKVVCKLDFRSINAEAGEVYEVKHIESDYVEIWMGLGLFGGKSARVTKEGFEQSFDKVEPELPPKFKDLSRKEQLELVEAALDGCWIERWVEHSNRWKENSPPRGIYFALHLRYRIADEKPVADDVIPWGVLDERWRWFARDKDGGIWVFECEPRDGNAHWVSDGREMCITGILAGYKPGTCDWRDSLQKRPEGV